MPATAVGSAKGRSISASSKPLAGKTIAHQHPGDDEAEHGIDHRRRQRHAEGQAQATPARGAWRSPPRSRPSPGEGPQHQRQQRHQHDAGEIEKREAQRKAEAGQHAPPASEVQGVTMPVALICPGW